MKQVSINNLLTRWQSLWQSMARVLLVGFLVGCLVLGPSGVAQAASSGGRIGGGSFSRPSRTYSAPRTYARPRGYTQPVPVPVPYGGGFGGGFGFPFLMPLFGFGGGFGGLFTILIMLALANFLMNTFRRVASGEDQSPIFSSGADPSNPPVAVNALTIALLAGAQDLKTDLNKIAKAADTTTNAGLTLTLQETVVALMRHPEYWAYAHTESQLTKLAAAEPQFNRLVLAERSKLTAETLINVKEQAVKETQGGLAVADQVGEYIVVTLIAATEGTLALPQVSSPQNVRQALNQLGAVGSDQLVALEILWQPQADGDTLSSDELVAHYPALKRL